MAENKNEDKILKRTNPEEIAEMHELSDEQLRDEYLETKEHLERIMPGKEMQPMRDNLLNPYFIEFGNRKIEKPYLPAETKNQELTKGDGC